MTKINLTYCGMEGEGPTVKEAKQDAARRIEAALDGDYAPVVVVWRNITSVMSRNPHGWGYRFLHPEGDTAIFCMTHCSSGWTDREQCLVDMCVHITDLAMLAEDTGPPEPISRRLYGADRREFERRWQERYARWPFHLRIREAENA